MFIWSEKFELGNKEIDKQHKHLFELGNALFNSKVDESDKHINSLFNYTKEHFSLEEFFMETKEYIGLERHKKIHSDLIEKLTVIKEIGISTTEELESLQSFVWDWIYLHILDEDIKYMQ